MKENVYHINEGEPIMQKKLGDYLDYFKEEPEKQQKVLNYFQLPCIFCEEFFLISMVNINDEELESKLIMHFINNEINKPHDFYKFLNKELNAKRLVKMRKKFNN